MKKFLIGTILSAFLLSSTALAAPQWYEPNKGDVTNPNSHSISVEGTITPKDKNPVLDPNQGFVLSVSAPLSLHFAVFDGDTTNQADDPTFSAPKYKFVNYTGSEVTVKIESLVEDSSVASSNDKYTLVNSQPSADNQIKLSLDAGKANSGFNSGVSTVLTTSTTNATIGKIPAAADVNGKEASFELSAQLHTSLPSKVLKSKHNIVFKFEANANGNIQRP